MANRETLKRISVRLSKNIVNYIKDLKEYKNFSDAVRGILNFYRETNEVPSNMERIILDIPKKDFEGLETLVKEGYEMDIPSSIRNAIKEYLPKE